MESDRLPETIASLTPEQRALLMLRLKQRAAAREQQEPVATPIKPVGRDRDLPLSFAQQRLWFLYQFDSANPAYNMPSMIRLAGRLDVAALAHSLNAVVERHEALRTTFATVGDSPCQIIAPALMIPLPIVDLGALDPAARAAELRRLSATLAWQVFDLERGPLLRAVLLRMDGDDHMLFTTIYHIVADGWSIGVFVHELAALYSARVAGQPSPLPDLPVQYADYAVWQREYLQGDVLNAHMDYWKQRLAGGDGHAGPPQLELPTDHPRPAVQSFRGTRRAFALTPELSAAIRALGQQAGATLFMLLLAAFDVLLARYSRQSDIVVGSPIANRTRREIEGLIGCFVNTLVLRADLRGDPTFRELTRRVREVTLDAYAHQDLPFERLVDELQIARDLSRNPLFQVMFVLHNTPMAPLEVPGMIIEPLDVDASTAKFDLWLSIVDSPGHLYGHLEYNTDLFDAGTITRMLGHLRTLLEAIVAAPDTRIGALPLLTADERRQLLVDWNATQAALPLDRCIHELFEEQVAHTPDAIAMVFADRQLTYAELNRRANRLAHALRGLGVGPERCVGICMERSFDLVVAVLGVLKAGGAYVALDPSFPRERLSFLLEDAHVAVLITQQRLLAALPPHDLQLLCLDTAWARLARLCAENPANGTRPENIMYVTYTSGSTGKPKGIAMPHRALLNLLAWQNRRTRLPAGARTLQFAALSFDVSFQDMFGVWCSGGTLVGISEAERRDLANLGRLLVDNAVQRLFIPAIALQQVAEGFGRELRRGSKLSKIIAGSEQLQITPAIADLFTNLPGCALHNEYGPSETHVVTELGLPPSVAVWPPRPPVGRPIANTQIYLLDQAMQPTPIGVPGELHIGGAGLARGYLGRPELTAERFIPNPFAEVSGIGYWVSGAEPSDTRLYKTGDLARYLPDGNIEFLGRIDLQVKLRGFRVEPGEIESVLSQHPRVRESVVIAREDTPGHKRLVAYVVPAEVAHDEGRTTNDESADSSFVLRHSSFVSEMRMFLKERLPEYMLPSLFVLLERLPLNQNGKVDRKALPAPDDARPDLGAPFVAPRTPAERALADVWMRVLRLKQVGIHDNFFELGGDSILSMQVVARANQAGLRLTVKQIFEHQTIAELAAVAASAPGVAAEQAPVSGPVPLLPIQHWFFERIQTDRHHWNMSLLLETQPDANPAWLNQIVQRLVEHHDALRICFAETEAGWRQFNTPPGAPVPFAWVDLAGLPQPRQARQIEAVTTALQTGFRLDQAPLMRVAFFAMGAGRPGRLFFVIHHLIVDSVSWRVLLDDFQAAYQQLGAGQPIQLPPKATSYQRWAERQVEYAQSEELRGQLAYWRTLLAGDIAPLPRDFPDGINATASTRFAPALLSPEDTRVLLQDVSKLYDTQAHEVLLTALGCAIARWTGAPALINVEGHGRVELFEDLDLTRTVGWCPSISPVVFRLRGDERPDAALALVKEHLRQVPQQGIGYGLLRYLCDDPHVAREMRALPAAEIMFNYHGQFDQVINPELVFRGGAGELTGPNSSSRGTRFILLFVQGSVLAGQMNFVFHYSGNIYRPATIEAVAGTFREVLLWFVARAAAEAPIDAVG